MAFKSFNGTAGSSDTVLDNVIFYEGEHSITFTKNNVSKNTWNDWGLIPSSRPSEPLNGIWNRSVSIDGTNGQEDLVRTYPYHAVNSYAQFRQALANDNPSGIQNDFGYSLLMAGSGSASFLIADQQNSFFVKQQEILNFLHNQDVWMRFMDDTTVNFHVRTTIETFDNGGQYSGVSIKYVVLG